MPLEAKLLRAIWAAAREHGVDRDGVHEAIAAGWPGKTSVKDLTDAQACQLLDGIRGRKRRQGHGPWARRQAMQQHGRRDQSPDGIEFLVTAEELAILATHARECGMDAKRLQGYCRRQIDADIPTTMRQYNKVLWGLKAMLRRMPVKDGDYAA